MNATQEKTESHGWNGGKDGDEIREK